MNGYGRYLGFLAATGRLTYDAPPASRVTPPSVRQYHASLEGLADYTVVNLIDELFAVIRALAPDEDWCWLRAVARNLRRLGHGAARSISASWTASGSSMPGSR